MAITSIKSTYSLDVDTVEALEAMAGRWKVSKSEALRRAIRAAAAQLSDEPPDSLGALDELQTSLQLDDDAAARWNERLRSERRAAGRRLAGS